MLLFTLEEDNLHRDVVALCKEVGTLTQLPYHLP